MKPGAANALRCAIYTRKSSEEGLEQDFNSLHAQREACEAYIKSQAHEGWVLAPTVYDDGGYSGGTMERPALRKLMDEVARGTVQIIIVYKVDRLTRSLADFARIVEQLDTHRASFVSVTQQFNTTSSMGRLTLNVLLSFAQFEREVTGERIRDKISASKRKGMWMGGAVPLGYAPDNRTLSVKADEAQLVKRLFDRYLALRSVPALCQELHAQGVVTKVRALRAGGTYGGGSFRPGALNHLLRNPIYLGEIRHKGSIFPGQHAAIIDREIWDQVQSALTANARRSRGARSAPGDYALCGKVYDTAGNHMTPTHTKKSDGSRYRYYISQALVQGKGREGMEIGRITAENLEGLVAKALAQLTQPRSLDAVMKVVVGRQEIRIEVPAAGKPIDEMQEPLVLSVPVCLYKRKLELEIRTPEGQPMQPASPPDRALVRALVKAHAWREMLTSGAYTSVDALGRAEGINPSYIARLLPLAFLSPALTQTILAGRQPRGMKIDALRKLQLPIAWDKQQALFLKYRY